MQALEKLIQDGDDIYLNGLIYQEILQGIKSEEYIAKLKPYLLSFSFLEETTEMHGMAAQLFRICKSKGITLSTIDALIATHAAENECFLLTTDEDFKRITKYSDLKLFPIEN